jgi:hypothetical protein
MVSVTPTTPRTWRIDRSTACLWYSYSTSPSSVTQPSCTPGVDLPLGHLHVPLQDVRDGPGDVGVVPRCAGQLDPQIVGHSLDPVHPLRGPGCGQPFRVGRDVTGLARRQ